MNLYMIVKIHNGKIPATFIVFEIRLYYNGQESNFWFKR